MLKVAILGLGNRGSIYLKNLMKTPNVTVTALCDRNNEKLTKYAKRTQIPAENAFTDDKAFFAAGKLADALVIATQDKAHYAHAMQALELNYHLLLEKPVSPDIGECQRIANLAKEKNLKVVVCHVLRYSGYYDNLKKVIDSGAIGDVVGINHTENIAYWHFVHSYVRGNWRNEAETSPSILAKCCHDLDMIYYLTGKKCIALDSVGALKLFTSENAPEGAPSHCMDGCKWYKTCPFAAQKCYFRITKHSLPYMIVNKDVVTGKPGCSIKELKETLKTSPYGRCVYKCDNDVMSNQVVTMQLEDNVTATLTMTAFTNRFFRRTHICGTKGEIYGTDSSGYFTLNVFGGKKRKIRTHGNPLIGHMGGDKGVVKDFVDYVAYDKKSERLALIETTLESHVNAARAEEARKSHIK